MESGAAIYIEKPFTLDYLKACIHSLLARRRHLKELYQDVGHVEDMNKYDVADRDEDFIRKLDKVVMQNLSDPDFAVKHLEEALCMSRSSLTRKMRALLDTKPVDYIRDKRLIVAAEMLKTAKGRVKEVCFAAGFNSSSYFAKCFRQKYGVLPTEYAGNMAETVQEDTNSPKDETN
jgi:transcriptional regulator GlxA family with amidase domain